jgi:hypothetical protein
MHSSHSGITGRDMYPQFERSNLSKLCSGLLYLGCSLQSLSSVDEIDGSLISKVSPEKRQCSEVLVDFLAQRPVRT